ncbi:MAG TPA: GxxExxY protein [Lysobacter sp.]
MKHELVSGDLTERVIGVFYGVYNELGWGFLESVYENSMAIALRADGLSARQQASMPVSFRGRLVGEFKADLLVEDRLVIELKSVSQLAAIHEVQLVNYLKASGIEVGLLLNFGPRPQLKRRVFSAASNPRSSALIRVENPRV